MKSYTWENVMCTGLVLGQDCLRFVPHLAEDKNFIHFQDNAQIMRPPVYSKTPVKTRSFAISEGCCVETSSCIFSSASYLLGKKGYFHIKTKKTIDPPIHGCLRGRPKKGRLISQSTSFLTRELSNVCAFQKSGRTRASFRKKALKRQKKK